MIKLIPMSKSEFEMYISRAVPKYADDSIRAYSMDPAVAIARAKCTYGKVLIDGIATENHYLFSIVDDEQDSQVGMIWFLLDASAGATSAFICDFEIFEEFRRKGYGRRTLQALENKLHREGVFQISLHVFAHNKAAQSLYKQLGYLNTGLHMARRLSSNTLEQ